MTLPTDLQSYQHVSKYARWIEGGGRREHWGESVDRYFSFFGAHLTKLEVPPAVVSRAIQMASAKVRTLQSLPSMRAFSTAGPALARDNACVFNCSYLAINHPRAWGEILYILACSAGVGFSVERQEIAKLPIVPDRLDDSRTTIIVRDSKRGWAESLDQLLALLYSGHIPSWDTSLVRASGTRLKTMGGRASGPGPLIDLFKFIIAVFKNAQGRRLNSLECHDITCMVGNTIIQGGVRRAALISLSNLSDQRMRSAKTGEWRDVANWREFANNSVAYTERPEVGQWMEEWTSLYNSKSGERGIFNRAAAIQQMAASGRRRISWDQEPALNYEGSMRDYENLISFGTNPCVPGDTLILTDQGHKPIIELVNQETNVWNGEEWAPVKPFATGLNPTVNVEFSDGTTLRCTPYHKFFTHKGFARDGKTVVKEARELTPGDKLEKFDMPVVEAGDSPQGIDAYSQGFYAGDGGEGLVRSYLYRPKYECADRLAGFIVQDGDRDRKIWKHGLMLDRNFVPITASSEFCLEWLSGLLDADGVVTSDKKGQGFQISSVDRQFLIDTRLMLSRLGVQAKISAGREAQKRLLPDGRGGTAYFDCQSDQRLLIGNTDALHLMQLGMRLSRLQHDMGEPNRDARQYVRVVSVEPAEPCETYCFTEPKTHRGTFNGIVTGQCGEITLRDMQFCNLTTAVCRPEDSAEDLADKVKIATMMGTWQATLTDFRHLRKEWKLNSEEERLLGVGLGGIQDSPILNIKSNLGEAGDIMRYLKSVYRETNDEWAELLKIRPAAAGTCVKPDGNSSLLTNASSGIHCRYARHYLRRVTQDNIDPVTNFMKDAGIPWEHLGDNPNSGKTLFIFPVAAPETALIDHEISALDKLNHWKLVRSAWCEHNPSATISVEEREWPSVGAWVWDNFDQIGGLSFMPAQGHHAYRWAPIEKIDEEVYSEALRAMPANVDWNGLGEYEHEDETSGAREFACVAGACDVEPMAAMGGDD